MVRLFNAYFPGRTLFLGASEMVLVSLSFVMAMVLWIGRDADLVLRYEGGFLKIALVTLVFLGCMYHLDLYDSMVLNNRREVWTRLMQVAGTATLILAGLYYAYPSIRLQLDVFVTGVFLLLLLVCLWRQAFIWACRSLHLMQRALVLGEGHLAFELANELNNRPEAGIKLLGYVNPPGPPAQDATVPQLGDTSALREIVNRHRVERIIVALGDRRGTLPIENLLSLKSEGVQVQDGADLYEALTGKVPLASLRLSWLLFSPGFRVSTPLLIYKRVFSILFSAALIIVTFPLMLLVALAIWLDSPGPIIFRQVRVGHRGKTFTLYKFRSMHHGVEESGNGVHVPAQDDDARCTRVGRWIRRTRLDELPQLLNILRGDMYFIGPRPFVPDQEEECMAHIPFYRQRWSVKPGATGWAQVHRGYCVTIEDNAEKLAYDLFYIKNMSVGLDLLIMLQTVKILLLGRGGQ